MKNTYFLLKILFTGMAFLLYLLFFCAALYGLKKDEAIIEIIRHVILVPGLIPLFSWLMVVIFAKSKNAITAYSLAAFQTLFHIPVFAFSAHSDRWDYWIMQAIEFLLLIPLFMAIFSRKKSNQQEEANPHLKNNAHK